jgi:hypothetical protein
MPRRKEEPIPDDIQRMTIAECKAEEKRMVDSKEFENAIELRDHWQAIADRWLTRSHMLTRRQVELLQAKHPEDL